MRQAEAAGVITVRPGEEDPAALALMAKLAVRSRERWPADLTGDQAAPRGCFRLQASGGAREPRRSTDLQGYCGNVVTFPLARHQRSDRSLTLSGRLQGVVAVRCSAHALGEG